MDNNKYQRKSFRLQRYNYSWPGCYFVTICTKDKEFVLSEIKNQNVVLNKYGQIVENVLQMSFRKYQHVSLDNYVIMPNHIHAIIKLNTAYIDHVDKDPYKRRNMLLSKFVGYFKMNSSKKINIILNKGSGELNLTVTTGANFSKNANGQTGGSDGEATNVAGSYGISLGERGGYINFSGDFDVRQDYSRMKEWEGDVFNQYNTVERFANADGYDVSALLDDDVTDVIQYSNAAGIDIMGATTKAELQPILSADNTESELTARGLVRSDFNMRVGQSALRGGRFFANFVLPLDDYGTELYSFTGISSRTGNSAGFYRLPNQSRTYTYVALVLQTMNGY